MNRIQAIKGFSQDHTHRTSYLQITNHQTHPSIYANYLMHHEVSLKNA